MNKWTDRIKEYWKDPVWSKVIATGIIFVLGTILTSLYAIFLNLYSNVSFKYTFKTVRDFSKTDIKLPLWTLLLLGFVFLIITLKPIVSFTIEVIHKIRKPKHIKPKNEIPSATENSTVLFSYRMAKAFPGIRDLTWFNTEILPLNWTATKICNLVVNYEKRTQKIQCQL